MSSTKTKRSTKGVEALVILLGVLIFVLTYFFGVIRLKDMTAALENDNRSLKAMADAYEYLFTNAPTYQNEIKEMQAEEEAIIDKFVYDYPLTDRIMYASNIEGNVRTLGLSYMTMGEPSSNEFTSSPITDPVLVAGGLENPTVSGSSLTLLSYPIEYGFEVEYGDFKKMVDYLNLYGGAKNIDTLTLSFDNSTGILNGNIAYNQLVLLGTDKAPQNITIPYVPTGVENVFGTIEIPASQEEVVEATTEQE